MIAKNYYYFFIRNPRIKKLIISRVDKGLVPRSTGPLCVFKSTWFRLLFGETNNDENLICNLLIKKWQENWFGLWVFSLSFDQEYCFRRWMCSDAIVSLVTTDGFAFARSKCVEHSYFLLSLQSLSFNLTLSQIITPMIVLTRRSLVRYLKFKFSLGDWRE